MNPVDTLRSWFSAKVLEPRRTRQTRRRIDAAMIAFIQAERIASKGEYASAISYFRRSFNSLTPEEQSSIGGPAFLDLWDVITDRSRYSDSKITVDQQEADELYTEGRLKPVLMGELHIKLDDIKKHHKAGMLVARIQANVECKFNPPLSDTELAEIQSILE